MIVKGNENRTDEVVVLVVEYTFSIIYCLKEKRGMYRMDKSTVRVDCRVLSVFFIAASWLVYVNALLPNYVCLLLILKIFFFHLYHSLWPNPFFLSPFSQLKKFLAVTSRLVGIWGKWFYVQEQIEKWRRIELKNVEREKK